jgi:hypothetical protein
MEKTKDQAGEQSQTGPRPTADDKVLTPEKGGGPAGATVQRAEAEPSAALPASTVDAPGPVRAAGMVANLQAGAGAAGRARLAGAMQDAVGNTRTGEMLEGRAGMQAAMTPVQTKGKNPAPKTPPPITLPLPKEAVRKPTGAAEFKAGEVKVVALPDKKSKKPIVVKGKVRSAKTWVRLNWAPPTAQTKDGKVTAVDPLPTPTLTIQTTYGPKASPEMKSTYGKGTTKEDIQAGKTSLGFHEGSHGEYAIQYTKDHPPPKFKGQAGMSVAEFKQAQDDYDQEMEEYRQALDQYHQVMTDCVGQKDQGCEE